MVQESWAGASSSRTGDVGAGFFLPRGCGASCWGGGWWLAGSSSISPRRRWLSTANSDPGAGGVGARPQSTGNRRGRFFFCDSVQNLRAKGLLQFMGMLVFFSGGDDRQREGRLMVAREGSSSVVFSSLLFGVFCDVWLKQFPLYTLRTVLYSYVYCTFSLFG